MTSLTHDWETDHLKTITHFENRLRDGRENATIQGWGSQASQRLRFQILSDIGDFHDKHLLDVGCGLADYHSWLKTHGFKGRYTGIDITPGMISQAKLGQPQLEVAVGDILDWEPSSAKRFDYVMASGIFYLREHCPYAFLETMVKRMYAVATRGVAFNSLSSWSASPETDEFYADPCRVLEICHGIASRVVLRHDYHPGDFTLYLYH